MHYVVFNTLSFFSEQKKIVYNLSKKVHSYKMYKNINLLENTFKKQYSS